MGLGELIRERDKRRCENFFLDFFHSAWKVLEPETPFYNSWHYEFIGDYLEIITRGGFRQRFPGKLGLIINVPPRTAKSTLVSVCWPVWSWIHRPSLRFLCASYAESLATDHSTKRRALLQSRWFQQRWGDKFQLSPDRNRQDDFGNSQMGYMVSTSVGGVVTGLGGDVCIADDLLSQDDSFSEAEKAATNRWIDSTWSTKLNNPASGVYVHISQRLAEDDPTGHLLEQQPGSWVHIKIPLECEQDEVFEFPGVPR